MLYVPNYAHASYGNTENTMPYYISYTIEVGLQHNKKHSVLVSSPVRKPQTPACHTAAAQKGVDIVK